VTKEVRVVALTVSEELGGFLYAITGEQFLGANEDKLWAAAEAVENAAVNIEEILPLLQVAMRTIRDRVGGMTQEAFVEAMQGYLREPGYLTLAAEQVRQLATALRERGTQVEYAKMQIIAGAIELMASFIFAAIFAFFNPASALTWLAARVTAFRFLHRAWMRWLLTQIIGTIVFETATEGFIDIVIQRIQIGQGHRDNFDWNLFREALKGGAIGGATQALLMPIIGGVGNVVTNQISNRITEQVVDRLITIGGAGLTEYIGAGFNALEQGQGWDVDGMNAVSGSIGATVDMGGDGIGSYLHNLTNPPPPSISDPEENTPLLSGYDSDSSTDDDSSSSYDDGSPAPLPPRALPPAFAAPFPPPPSSSTSAPPSSTPPGPVPPSSLPPSSLPPSSIPPSSLPPSSAPPSSGPPSSGPPSSGPPSSGSPSPGSPSLTPPPPAPASPTPVPPGSVSAGPVPPGSATGPVPPGATSPGNAPPGNVPPGSVPPGGAAPNPASPNPGSPASPSPGSDSLAGSANGLTAPATIGSPPGFGGLGDPVSGADGLYSPVTNAPATAGFGSLFGANGPVNGGPGLETGFGVGSTGNGLDTFGSQGGPRGSETSGGLGVKGEFPGVSGLGDRTGFDNWVTFGDSTGPDGFTGFDSPLGKDSDSSEVTAGSTTTASGQVTGLPITAAPASTSPSGTPGTATTPPKASRTSAAQRPAGGIRPEQEMAEVSQRPVTIPSWTAARQAFGSETSGPEALRSWVRRAEESYDRDSADPVEDCVDRAWEAYSTLYGKRGNRAVDEATGRDGLRGMLNAIGGQPSTVADPATVWQAIEHSPGAMALVVARPQAGRSHVYWLLADSQPGPDGRPGEVVPRWIDTQVANAFATPATLDGAQRDWWAQQLHAPGTQVMIVDSLGKPQSLTAQAVSRTVQSLVDAPAGPHEPGMAPKNRTDANGEQTDSEEPDEEEPAEPEGLEAPASLAEPLPGRGSRLLSAILLADPQAVGRLEGWTESGQQALERISAGTVNPEDVQMVADDFARLAVRQVERMSQADLTGLPVSRQELEDARYSTNIMGRRLWLTHHLQGQSPLSDTSGTVPAVIGRILNRTITITGEGTTPDTGGLPDNAIRITRRNVPDNTRETEYPIYGLPTVDESPTPPDLTGLGDGPIDRLAPPHTGFGQMLTGEFGPLDDFQEATDLQIALALQEDEWAQPWASLLPNDDDIDAGPVAPQWLAQPMNRAEAIDTTLANGNCLIYAAIITDPAAMRGVDPASPAGLELARIAQVREQRRLIGFAPAELRASATELRRRINARINAPFGSPQGLPSELMNTWAGAFGAITDDQLRGYLRRALNSQVDHTTDVLPLLIGMELNRPVVIESTQEETGARDRRAVWHPHNPSGEPLFLFRDVAGTGHARAEHYRAWVPPQHTGPPPVLNTPQLQGFPSLGLSAPPPSLLTPSLLTPSLLSDGGTGTPMVLGQLGQPAAITLGQQGGLLNPPLPQQIPSLGGGGTIGGGTIGGTHSGGPPPPPPPPPATALAFAGTDGAGTPFAMRFAPSLWTSLRLSAGFSRSKQVRLRAMADQIARLAKNQHGGEPLTVEIDGGSNGLPLTGTGARSWGQRRAWAVRKVLEPMIQQRLKGTDVEVRFAETSRGGALSALHQAKHDGGERVTRHEQGSVLIGVRQEASPPAAPVVPTPVSPPPAPVQQPGGTIAGWLNARMTDADRLSLRGNDSAGFLNALILADPAAIASIGDWTQAAATQLQLAAEAVRTGPVADPAQRFDVSQLDTIRQELAVRMRETIAGELPQQLQDEVRRLQLIPAGTGPAPVRASLTDAVTNLPPGRYTELLMLAGFMLHRTVILAQDNNPATAVWEHGGGPPVRLFRDNDDLTAWVPGTGNGTARYELAEPISLPGVAFSAGVVRGSLPNLDEMVTHLADLARANNVTVTQNDESALAQQLISQARYLVSGGAPVIIGGVEFLVNLTPDDPHRIQDPGQSFDRSDEDPPSGRVRDEAHAIETIQGVFDVSAHSQGRSGPTSSTRAKIGLAFGFGLPGVLDLVRVSGHLRFVANASGRSTGSTQYAETGHVEDTRDKATTVSARAQWSVKTRTVSEDRWDSITATQPAIAPGARERMLTSIPDHYLKPAEDTLPVGVSIPGRPEPGREHERQRNARNISRTYYASGLTNLAELSDEMLAGLRAQNVDVRIGSPLRTQAMQLLWNLDTRLDDAVNKVKGYEFVVSEGGRIVAQISVHSRRVRASRVGLTSAKAHLELVRTAISAHRGGHTVSQEMSGELGLDLPFTPEPLSITPRIYGKMGFFNRDSVGAGRTGLTVLANRYSGLTTGYDAEFEHRVRVTTRPPRNVLRRGGRDVTRQAISLPRDSTSAPVTSRTLLRLPTAEAQLHGFDVPATDPATVAPPAPARPRLPAHIRAKGGVGQSLTRVDEHVVEDLRHSAVPELQKHGFLPQRMDRPFHRTSFWAWSPKLDSQIQNRKLFNDMISSPGLDSHYNQIHQDGMPFTLRKRHSGLFGWWRVRTAQVKVIAELQLPGNLDDIPSKITEENQLVYLSMGLDAATQGTGGGRQFAVGAKVRFGPADSRLQGASLGIAEYDRSISANDSITNVTNMPKLLEYPGALAEFRLRSQYTVQVEYSQHYSFLPTNWGNFFRSPRPWQWFRTRRPRFAANPVNGEATVQLVPHFNTTPRLAAPAPTPVQQVPQAQRTPVNVLRQAAIYHLDTTGMLPAAQRVTRGFAEPGGPADDEILNIANHTNLMAHLYEIMRGRFSTDTLFESRLFRDKFGWLSVKGEMGRSTFVGATPDKYVLGLIQLSLDQAGQTHSRSSGWSPGSVELGEGADPAGERLMNVGGSQSFSFRVGSAEGRTRKTTGGRELLELNFQRGYAFHTSVDMSVRSTIERNAKVVWRTITGRSATVAGRDMIYLLSEPDALEHYAQGNVPISDDQLTDVFTRWQSGELKLDNALAARILIRWQTGRAPLPTPRPQKWVPTPRERLASRLAERYQFEGLLITDQQVLTDFHAQFGQALTRDPAALERTMWTPPYLDGPGAKSLGHAGVKELTLDNNQEIFELIRQAVDEAAPGLLGRDHAAWTDGTTRVLWARPVDPGAMVGRLQGGLDALQAVFAGDRPQPATEQMLHNEGMSIFLMNPFYWGLGEIIEINIKLDLTSGLTFGDFIPDSGIENYSHAYVETSVTEAKSHSRGFGAGAGFATDVDGQVPETPQDKQDSGQATSGQSLGVRASEGRTRQTAQSEQTTRENTVYDWAGHYPADATFRMNVVARRRKMVGRPINNKLSSWLRSAQDQRFETTRTATGNITLKVPKGLAEAQPFAGPAPRPSTTPITQLPGDAYLHAALIDDGAEAARELLGRVLSPEANDPTWRSSLSANALFSRFQQAAHLSQAIRPGGFRLADDLFMPGHSSDRAEMNLHAELYNLEVIAPIQGAGTGFYGKYNKGTSATLTHETPHTVLSAGFGIGGKMGNNGEATDKAEAPAHRFDPGTDVSREAPMSVSDNLAESYRREQHVKQLGDSVLVRVSGTFWLTAAQREHGFGILSPTEHAQQRSANFSGDIYLQMFAGQAEELQRQQAQRGLDDFYLHPVPQPRRAYDSVRVTASLTEELTQYGATEGATPQRAAHEVARRLGDRVGQQEAIRLTTRRDANAARILAEIRDWARTAFGGQPLLTAAEATFRRDLTITTPEDVQLASHIIDRVRAHAGPHQNDDLPMTYRTLHLDPIETARIIARDLNVEVYLDIEGNPAQQHAYIDQQGRVFRLQPNGHLHPFQRAMEGLAPALRDEARAAGLTFDTMFALYNAGNFLTRLQNELAERQNPTATGPVVIPPARISLPTTQQLDRLTDPAGPLAPLENPAGGQTWLEAILHAQTLTASPPAPQTPLEIRQSLATILRDPAAALPYAPRITANPHSSSYTNFLDLLTGPEAPAGDHYEQLLRFAPEMLGWDVTVLEPDGTVRQFGTPTAAPLSLMRIGSEYFVLGPAGSPGHVLKPRSQAVLRHAADQIINGHTTMTLTGPERDAARLAYLRAFVASGDLALAARAARTYLDTLAPAQQTSAAS
jgi:hypothetical protein